MFSKHHFVFVLRCRISNIMRSWKINNFMAQSNAVIQEISHDLNSKVERPTRNAANNQTITRNILLLNKELRHENLFCNFIRSNRLLKTTGLIESSRIVNNTHTHKIFAFYPIRGKKTCCETQKKDKSLEELLFQMSEPVTNTYNKITVLGVGDVGTACAFSLLTQKVTNDVVIIDKDQKKLEGESLDLQQGALSLNNYQIRATTNDYSITKNSRICIIAAGARQAKDESRLNLVQRNAEIFKGIIPELVKYSPDTILLVVSNPVDVLTYVAWRLSGLPPHRVIGSGTHLDTARFRLLLSQRFKISTSDCHGWIIGEHGDSCVPLWSSVNIAGTKLIELNPNIGTCEDAERWGEIRNAVVESAYKIIKLKGHTSWAVALIVTNICIGILRNSMSLYAISTLVKGFHGVEDNVFLSLPSSLGENGVTQVVKQKLDCNEHSSFRDSAKIIAQTNSQIKIN